MHDLDSKCEVNRDVLISCVHKQSGLAQAELVEAGFDKLSLRKSYQWDGADAETKVESQGKDLTQRSVDHHAAFKLRHSGHPLIAASVSSLLSRSSP